MDLDPAPHHNLSCPPTHASHTDIMGSSLLGREEGREPVYTNFAAFMWWTLLCLTPSLPDWSYVFHNGYFRGTCIRFYWLLVRQCSRYRHHLQNSEQRWTPSKGQKTHI